MLLDCDRRDDDGPKDNSRLAVAVSIAISLVLHAAGLAFLSTGLLRVPRIEEPSILERYAVRQLNLHRPQEGTTASHVNGRSDEMARATAKQQLASSVRPGGGAAAQTLIQPDFRTHQTLQAPIPSVMIWTPELATKRDIVAPLPDAASNVDASTSLEAPNQELQAGQVAIAAAISEPRVATPPPATTSPLPFHTKSLVNMAPATTSNSEQQPTPTAVLSISDLKMHDGAIVLPPANQTSGNAINPLAGANGGVPAMTGNGAEPIAGAQSRDSENDPELPGQELVHVELPRDGRFGVLAVGALEAEGFPEALDVWNGRTAYTAFLHVGTAKSWILQYAIARGSGESGAAGVEKIEAPWAYDIFRPKFLSRSITSDVLMVHARLNESGHLEALTMAFPSRFPAAPFLLSALRRWGFRPARQHGIPVSIEVLLIIPEED